MKQQVKQGKAQILTTIFGSAPEYYDIDILPDGQIGSFYKRIDE